MNSEMFSEPAIDAHIHLGDIFFPNGGKVVEQKGATRGKMLLDMCGLMEILSFRTLGLYPFTKKLVVNSVYKRGLAGSRENMRKAMNEANVKYSVVLPIPPYVYFDDIHPAYEKDRGIIPFTAIDYDNLDKMPQKLAEDVQKGAKGMKLHPIVQGVPLTSKETFQGVEEFAQYNLPILFHSGHFTYPRPKGIPANPTYGAISDAEKLVAAFPNVRFIAGHGGVMSANETIQRLSRYDNVWLDTSTQPAGNIRKLVSAFGSDKVMYASDWPFTGMVENIKSVKKAFRKDKSLERKVLFENASELLQVS